MEQRALLFSDVVDSTSLVERLGDGPAARLWAEHDRLAHELLERHGGREIDRSDGFFLLFGAAADAAGFAVDYHVALGRLGLAARVGIHAGPVTLRQNAPAAVSRGAKPLEVDGLAKPMAARVMSLARGGQTLLSEAAHGALSELPDGTSLQAHGYYRLKGIQEPQAVFELSRGGTALPPPADTEKAYRVLRDGDLWRPLREVRHNLAPERDAFVGRGVELRELAQRLDAGERCVTVLGAGGTGKTRLVRRYAAAWLGEWSGGVCFCDLSEARSVEGICFAVASALEVPLGSDDPILQLGHALAARGHCLLILDNFEQVAQHSADTLGRWYDRAGEATFVVTSRERLQLPGERVLALEPLPLDTEAIELFELRARAQRSSIDLDEAARASVREMVRLLDGLPLAIELAAARVRVLSPAQIVQRLKDRFMLLAGAKGVAARQATLKATIDWSWDLLAPWEQAALAQCSVFEGGFTLEAAEAVLDVAEWDQAPPIIDVVQSLADKSLLRAWVPSAGRRVDASEPCFGMSFSVHEYAQHRLATMVTPAATGAIRRHGEFFARLGTDAAIDALFLHGGIERRRALAGQLGNLVSACRRAVARGDAECAVSCLAAAWHVVELQGPLSLGSQLGSEVAAMPGLSPGQRARASVSQAAAAWHVGKLDEAKVALDAGRSAAQHAADARCLADIEHHLGTVARLQGRVPDAFAHFERATQMFRSIGHRGGEGAVLGLTANLLRDVGQMEQGAQCSREAIEILHAIGDRAREAWQLGGLGVGLVSQGQYEAARGFLQKALEVHREAGNRREATMILNSLANMARTQGRYDDADKHYSEALCSAREVGIRMYEGVVLGNLAGMVDEHGRVDEARSLFEQALAILRELGIARSAAVVIGNLGVLARRQGRYDDAHRHLAEALAIHREHRNRRFEGLTLKDIADLHGETGEHAAALAVLDDAQAILREVRDRVGLLDTICIRADVLRAAGDFTGARRVLCEAEALSEDLSLEPDSERGRTLAALRGKLSGGAGQERS